MLSKKMYMVLSCFPRNYTAIAYEALVKKCKLSEDEIKECLAETLFPEWNYVRTSDGWKNGSELTLTESGLAKVEGYEQDRKNWYLVVSSLVIAVIAMLASAASAVAAFLSLGG